MSAKATAATYEPRVETNLKTRITGSRLGRAADEVQYHLNSTDVEAAYDAATITEMAALRDRLYELANQAMQYVEDKKAGKLEAPAANGKPNVDGLTNPELRALYQELTGAEAPKSWRSKKALVEGIMAA